MNNANMQMRKPGTEKAGGMNNNESTRAPRELGFWMCTALVVGNTIGMGIFVLPASLAPYGLNALIGWVITLIGFLFIARVFAGLARAFPDDDGPYAYTNRAFGEGVAFMVLWCYWVATWITNATIAIGVVGYLSTLVPALKSNPWWPPLTALSLVWFFVLLNLRGARTAGSTQIVTVVLKLLPMIAVVLLGIWELVFHPAEFTTHTPTTPLNLGSIMSASTIAIFAMLGVECAAVPAGRVEDPARTIPRATMVGTVLTALIYIAISIVPMLLITQTELAGSNAPFADLFDNYVGSGSGQLLAIFVIISGLGALNGWTLVVGEVTQNFAKRGSFPRFFAKLNSHAAPARAFILTGVVASIMLIFNYNDTMVGIFTFLSVVVTAANLPLYLFCALAVLILWRRGEIARPGAREMSLFVAAILASAYSVWAFMGVDKKALLWAVALGGVGLLWYLWFSLTRRHAESVAGRAT
jgi:APA family basic amino acid/polyamine antiporter